MSGVRRKLHSVALNLDPAQFLAGWRPDEGVLFVPTMSDGRVGDEVAVRIGIFGQTIRATVFGSISLVRRVGRPTLPPGAELTLDRVSLPAAQFLALASRGERVVFRERAPRYVVERPLIVVRDATPIETKTINVSEGGCALAWSGPLPMVGEVVSIKLGVGLFTASARAVICWNNIARPLERSTGARLIARGRALRAWKNLIVEVANKGAKTI